ncbi:hypothetical protein ACS0TY_027715 [Phlomoides rotata]
MVVNIIAGNVEGSAISDILSMFAGNVEGSAISDILSMLSMHAIRLSSEPGLISCM